MSFEELDAIRERIEKFTSSVNESIEALLKSESFQRAIGGFTRIENMQKFGKMNWVIVFPEMYIAPEQLSEDEDVYFCRKIDEYCFLVSCLIDI
ncbi:hypothetical protein [Butyrivibrio sp. INlla14]|uniref:hypothetical protein n=1 Tax=Butyrivibrio sp. INlla14 TaxID=1520808 RepID=UPI00087659A7|nr:hypothetical protein [Butyrivibrio sp. INlla14]SCY21205.1 hypothetical protein SAMN02910371_01463 [Butyrivibrio sp. INlla14]